VLYKIPWCTILNRETIIHKLDPRTKLVSLVIVLAPITIVHEFELLVGMSVLLFVVGYLARIPGVVFLRSLKPFVLILGIIFLFHSFYVPGKVVWRFPLGDISVTIEGMIQAVYFSWQMILIIGFGYMLLLTTQSMAFSEGIIRLLSSLRMVFLPLEKLRLILNLSFRFIPTVFAEADRIRLAQLARGADFKGGIHRRVRHSTALLIPLFVAVIHRAQQIAMAIEARGFSGGDSFPWGDASLRMVRRDIITLFICGFIVTFCCLLAVN